MKGICLGRGGFRDGDGEEKRVPTAPLLQEEEEEKEEERNGTRGGERESRCLHFSMVLLGRDYQLWCGLQLSFSFCSLQS